MCGVEYCLRCDCIYHVEKTCAEVQEEKRQAEMQAAADKIDKADLPEDKQLEEWARAVGAKRCTKCRYWV